jgi:hypothetical protein
VERTAKAPRDIFRWRGRLSAGSGEAPLVASRSRSQRTAGGRHQTRTARPVLRPSRDTLSAIPTFPPPLSLWPVTRSSGYVWRIYHRRLGKAHGRSLDCVALSVPRTGLNPGTELVSNRKFVGSQVQLVGTRRLARQAALCLGGHWQVIEIQHLPYCGSLART